MGSLKSYFTEDTSILKHLLNITMFQDHPWSSEIKLKFGCFQNISLFSDCERANQSVVINIELGL